MAHGPIPDPKHDAESLALEEQLGTPALDLDFGAEGRLVIRLPDNRAARRAFSEADARLAALAQRSRPNPHALTETALKATAISEDFARTMESISTAVGATPEQVDRLAKRAKELGEDSK